MEFETLRCADMSMVAGAKGQLTLSPQVVLVLRTRRHSVTIRHEKSHMGHFCVDMKQSNARVLYSKRCIQSLLAGRHDCTKASSASGRSF